MIVRILIATLFSLFALSAHAVTVTASFKVPTAREDGTPLAASELSTCRLHDVTGTTQVKVADMGLTGTYEHLTVETGTKKYAADCVDKNGIASKLSPAVTITLGSSSPPGATSISIKLIYVQPAGTTAK